MSNNVVPILFTDPTTTHEKAILGGEPELIEPGREDESTLLDCIHAVATGGQLSFGAGALLSIANQLMGLRFYLNTPEAQLIPPQCHDVIFSMVSDAEQRARGDSGILRKIEAARTQAKSTEPTHEDTGEYDNV